MLFLQHYFSGRLKHFLAMASLFLLGRRTDKNQPQLVEGDQMGQNPTIWPGFNQLNLAFFKNSTGVLTHFCLENTVTKTCVIIRAASPWAMNTHSALFAQCVTVTLALDTRRGCSPELAEKCGGKSPTEKESISHTYIQKRQRGNRETEIENVRIFQALICTMEKF